VGKAVANALGTQHEIIVQDPKYTDYKMIDHHDADGIIVCVGTPSLPNGGCDCRDIANVLDDVPIFMPILIKSSVTPEVIEALAEIYPNHCITYSPEFLRATSANTDFINQKYSRFDCDTYVICEKFQNLGYNKVYLNKNIKILHIE
jgi:UDP-glucose 6-dehydrogenase